MHLFRNTFVAVAALTVASAATPTSAAEPGPIEPGNLLVANFQAFPGFGNFVGTIIQFDLSTRSLGNIKKIKTEIGDPDGDLFDGDPFPPLPWGPGGMAIGGPNGNLYVASILRGTITQFDHRDGSPVGASVQVVPIPGPEALTFGLRGMVWGPNGNLFVSVCGADGNVFGAVDAVFELDRNTLETVREIRQAGDATIDCFGGIGFGPDDLLYISGIFSGNVVALDLSTATPTGEEGVYEADTARDIFMLEDGESAFDTLAALTFSPDGTLFVSIGQGGEPSVDARIAIVAPGSDVPTGAIPAGQPTGIRMGADGNLYVGDLAARAVLVIDPATGEILRTIENGRKGLAALDPRFVIFNPAPFQ